MDQGLHHVLLNHIRALHFKIHKNLFLILTPDIEPDFSVQSVRIDKLEFEPKKHVVVSSQGMRIYVPDKHRPSENIAVEISKEDVTEIYCYLCDELCVLLFSVTGQCIENIQKSLETDDADDTIKLFEENNQIILQLDCMISEALKALQSIFASKIIDLDERKYIDAMDKFYERRYVWLTLTCCAAGYSHSL